MAFQTEEHIPINIVFWPETESNGRVNVNAQYQCSLPIKNVVITFPTPSRREPQDIICDNGDTAFHRSDGELQWILNDLEPESEGSIEYAVNGVEVQDLYPVSIHFEMQDTYSQIEIKVIRDIDNEQAYEFEMSRSCVAENYGVEY